jgi:hypothetical protein
MPPVLSGPATVNEPVTSRVPGVYRALFLKAESVKAIIPDPPRKAGEYDGDSGPKDVSPQVQAANTAQQANNSTTAPVP